MEKLGLKESLITFQRLFWSAAHEMFKAEVLQDYPGDDCSSLEAWLRGNVNFARDLGRLEPSIVGYRRMCLESPADITRVHVVEQPHSEYLKWEIAVCYQDSLLAHGAESIMLVPKTAVSDLELPAGDFWIFDDTKVLQWEYGEDGRTTGALLWDESRGDDISHFRFLREALLAAAHPVEKPMLPVIT